MKLSKKQPYVANAAYTAKLTTFSSVNKTDLAKNIMRNELFIKYGSNNPPQAVIDNVNNRILAEINTKRIKILRMNHVFQTMIITMIINQIIQVLNHKIMLLINKINL